MPEHLIRLRGAWLALDPHDGDAGDGSAGADDQGRRINLPITWPAGTHDPVRLVRSFGPPPFDPDHESLILRLEAIDGLESARLNGREIARPSPGTTRLDIPLTGPLPRRNVLILDLTPPVPRQGPAPWGAIALVIASRGP